MSYLGRSPCRCGAVFEGRGVKPTDHPGVAGGEALRALRVPSSLSLCEGVHLCAAPPPGRAVQRFGLHLTWLFRVLGGHDLPLAAQDLSTPMAQTLSDAVAGPATFTHVRVGVRMYVRMNGPLDLISLYGRLTGLVVSHAPSVAPSPDPRQGRRSRGEAEPSRWATLSPVEQVTLGTCDTGLPWVTVTG